MNDFFSKKPHEDESFARFMLRRGLIDGTYGLFYIVGPVVGIVSGVYEGSQRGLASAAFCASMLFVFRSKGQ